MKKITLALIALTMFTGMANAMEVLDTKPDMSRFANRRSAVELCMDIFMGDLDKITACIDKQYGVTK